MRRLAERAPELAAEVRRRQPGGAGQVGDRERLEVPGVGEVLGSQQVTGGRHHSDGEGDLDGAGGLVGGGREGGRHVVEVVLVRGERGELVATSGRSAAPPS